MLRAAVAVATAAVAAVGADLPPALRDGCLAALLEARALVRDGSRSADQVRARLDLVHGQRPSHLSERGEIAFWCAFHASEAPLLVGGRAAVHVANQVFDCAVSFLTFGEIVRLAREELLALSRTGPELGRPG